jgi:hypothetical protein
MTEWPIKTKTKKEFEKDRAAEKAAANAPAIAAEARRDASRANNRVSTSQPSNIKNLSTPIKKPQSTYKTESSGSLPTAPTAPSTNASVAPSASVAFDTASITGASAVTLAGTAITATPTTPTMPVIISPPPPAIKTATPDIVLFDEETLGVDEIVDLIFENLSGQELINISRSDIINGQKITYQPIKNLSKIQQIYNSNNIISLQQTEDKYFAGFSIKLENKIPNEGNGENGKNVYIDEQTGDLIIEFVNLNNEEQIETQITLSGTIYEINLGDYTS